MQIANLTLASIDRNLEADDGATFRGHFKEAISEISDAFNSVPDFLPRAHLGASLIGRQCLRELWYSFHWVYRKQNSGQMIRLFHRGHLEEARFIALVRTAGLQSWHSHEGKQFKISDIGGHYGGSLDGICTGCPDIPNGEAALLEFKTHGKKSFEKLVKNGVRIAKPEHYTQCNQYMPRFGLNWTVYMAVEKDTDKLHIEIFKYDPVDCSFNMEKATKVLTSQVPPERLTNDASDFRCKFCDYKGQCFYGEEVLQNCRTCKWVQMRDNGVWHCCFHDTPQDKAAQFAGCAFHEYIPGL